MLPDPHHDPAEGREFTIDASVPSDILLYLVPPKIGILHRSPVVSRTGVPEATVDEDRHLRPDEGEIG